MPTGQRKSGGGMIESDSRPGRGGMAARAIGAAAAAMDIILGMAGAATGADPFPALSGMTRHALGRAVRTAQCKPR